MNMNSDAGRAMQRDLNDHDSHIDASTHNHPTNQPRTSTMKDTNTTEHILLSMQQKLDEVELASSDSLIFDSSHTGALENLRAAQIQLAQAWMRSECDDLVEGEHADLSKRSLIPGGDIVGLDENRHQRHEYSEDNGFAGDGAGIEPGPSAGIAAPTGSIGGKSSMKDAIDTDLLQARKRREFNEAHFKKVNASVMDVIEKLEHVATAMVEVEQESRDIWASESDTGSS